MVSNAVPCKRHKKGRASGLAPFFSDLAHFHRRTTCGRPNHFDLEPLFKAVEKLYDADQEAMAEAAKKPARRSA
jgi:hypothetical protein